MTKRVFTIKTALDEYFQKTIGESTLRELVKKGSIQHMRAGAKILIKEEWLDQFMEKGGTNT